MEMLRIVTAALLVAAVAAPSDDEGPVNLKQKGWKLAGLTDALTEAEAVAAGFVRAEYAAATEPEATANRAVGSDEAGREEKEGGVIGA